MGTGKGLLESLVAEASKGEVGVVIEIRRPKSEVGIAQ